MNLIGNPRASFFIWLTFGGVFLLGIAATVYVYGTVDTFLKQGIVARAETIASALDPEMVNSLSGSEADLLNPSYDLLKSRMQDIHAVNHDSRFVYLMGKRIDGTVFFYVDSENPSSEDYSPPGQTYDEASELVRNMFESKQAAIEVASDRWGSWVSGLAPIIDLRTGDTVAIAGIDIDMKSYTPTLAAYASVPLSATIIILLVLFMAYRRRIEEERRINARAELLAVASHEIRAPLTGIRWAAESILTNTESLPSEIRKKLESVYESSLLIIDRISNLLTANALEHKGAPKPFEIVPLRPQIENAISMILLVAEEKSLKVSLDDSLSENIQISGDIEKIQTLFANLISNAVKYADSNTEVKIGFTEKEGGYQITISNIGDEIPAKDLPHIFSGYYRGSNVAGKTEGTGMGLFLVEKIVLMHGGTVGVESKGKETIFTVTLPKVAEKKK